MIMLQIKKYFLIYYTYPQFYQPNDQTVVMYAVIVQAAAVGSSKNIGICIKKIRFIKNLIL